MKIKKELKTNSFVLEKDLKSEIILLERESFYLKQISNIRNILISNGAYSDKNMQKQDMQFLNLNVPGWEKKIIRDSWDATKKLSHSLFERLDKLNEMILNDTNGSIKQKTPKDVLKEKLKKNVDNL